MRPRCLTHSPSRCRRACGDLTIRPTLCRFWVRPPFYACVWGAARLCVRVQTRLLQSVPVPVCSHVCARLCGAGSWRGIHKLRWGSNATIVLVNRAASPPIVDTVAPAGLTEIECVAGRLLFALGSRNNFENSVRITQLAVKVAFECACVYWDSPMDFGDWTPPDHPPYTADPIALLLERHGGDAALKLGATPASASGTSWNVTAAVRAAILCNDTVLVDGVRVEASRTGERTEAV